MVNAPNTMDRVKELFQGTVTPYPFIEFARVPVFLADFYLNFRRFVWDDGYLDRRTKAVIAFAVIVHLNCKAWASWFESTHLPNQGLPAEAANDIRAVVATCSMHNAYFKGLDFTGITLVGKTHGLRSHTPHQICLDKDADELIAVVISALNGCHRCANGHARALIHLGDPAIQEAFLCAATMVAGVSFLNSL